VRRGSPSERGWRYLALSCAVVLGVLVLPTAAPAGTQVSRIDPARVKGCRSFVVVKGHDSLGHYEFRASHVRRSAAIRCSMARKLLKAAYHTGPLHVVRTVYEHDSHGRKVGRPTYWLRGGWRCSNGAGGAVCWNVRKPRLNAVHFEGAPHGFAVSADVG
jgi:hypothetical protein